jgi:hypothetical protein
VRFSGVWPGWSDTYAVSKMNDAVSEPALVEEFELRADVVEQRALAAAHHDRPEEQMTLVVAAWTICLAAAARAAFQLP